MTRICLCLVFWWVGLCLAHAQQSDTVYVSDFGAKVYSYENCVTQIQSAIQACKERKAQVLYFSQGRYDIWPEGAIRRDYFISNTSSEEECPSKIKTVGLLFEGIEDLKVEGNGALLMFHGEMTTIVLEQCRRVSLYDLHIDFQRPSGSELQYVRTEQGKTVVNVHRDTDYEIVDGRMYLYGEGWKSHRNHCIEFDPDRETFCYSDGWHVLSSVKAEELEPGIVCFSTPQNFFPKKGNVLTIRDVIRDQVGMFILESQNVLLDGMQMHYMHGLGIVSQYSENITMSRVRCVPRLESGRVLAASADMMHFSGCKGLILIDSCYFSGAHDDPINIHGTNLRALEKINSQTLNLRFMHGQSYGFQSYFIGDTVAFVKAVTMERLATACVRNVKRLSDRVWQVEFDRDVPNWLDLNKDCVENLSCTPSVVIRDNYFTRTSTRGTLVTTPRSVLIENNVYCRTGMSAILIEGDAEGWFESGPVCDVWIKGNTFIDCAYNGGPGNAVIAINPSNSIVDVDHPVHKNIRIEGNRFDCYDYPILYAKSTEGLSFVDNMVVRTTRFEPVADNKNMFYLNGCKHVSIQRTTYEGNVLGKNVFFENMKRRHLKSSNELKVYDVK